MARIDPRILLAIRLIAGAVFVVFGIGKGVAYDAEVDAFRGYGLPSAGVAVVLVGAVELVGGLLLLAGRWVRPAAAVLAANMAGAFLVAGVVRGELVPSLTLAPLLLAGMVVLVAAGDPRGN